MKSKLFIVATWCCLLASCRHEIKPGSLPTPFEASDSLETATYEEGIQWWKSLEKESPYVCVREFGDTDAGHPLHLVIINADRNFSKEHITNSGKSIWLINNAIHPGEPDGVDASMLYARHLLQQDKFKEKMEDMVILIIPFYNVGGALNRNCCSRANQNGPSSYGFRGNARNLDLNRDFAKVDSRNAASFVQLFSAWEPDIYLETHVSNGADYPYTMTYLASHADKLSPPMNTDIRHIFIDPLNEAMRERNDPMIPYVNLFGTSPDSGYNAFYDTPRYSTGFTALHYSYGFLTESHMLKPFKDRVVSTLNFLQCMGDVILSRGEEIRNSRESAMNMDQNNDEYVLDWEVDKVKYEKLLFKGYKAYIDSSGVTGMPQLYYDRQAPWEREIRYFNQLAPLEQVTAPKAYLVPRAFHDVISRLEWHGVEMEAITHDTALECTLYGIDHFETVSTPNEGHYFHFNTRVSSRPGTVLLRRNEYFIVKTAQKKRRFLVEMLEPEAPDSYFNWNFFDEILQQKEWFSAYVFDQEAEELLDDPEIKKAYDTYLSSIEGKSAGAFERLYFLYRMSDHFEKERYKVYPVYRIE